MSTKVHANGEVQLDYIEHGSDEHAAHIGIRKAKKGDDPELVIEGWTLVDPHPYGVFGWALEYRREHLRQKVSGFLTKPPTVQSDDPSAPNYAPAPWMPRELDESPVRGIV